MTTAPSSSVRPSRRFAFDGPAVRAAIRGGLLTAGVGLVASSVIGCVPTYEGDVQLGAGERAVLEMSGERVELRVDNLGPAAISTFLNDGAGLNANDPVLASGDGWARSGPGPMRLILRNLDPDSARVRLRIEGHDGLRMELRGGANASPDARPVPVVPVPDGPSSAGNDEGR